MNGGETVLESLLKTGCKIEIETIQEYGKYYFYASVDKLNLTGIGETFSESLDSIISYVLDNMSVLLRLLYDDKLKRNEIPKLHKKLQKEVKIIGKDIKKELEKNNIYFVADLKRKISDIEEREKIWISLLHDNGLGDEVKNLLNQMGEKK